eukprot:TRINITY_DN1689_c0_g1_i2.p1 TRINITY_DN1689_c0_g1~~TRINITY_DN1689_c0_g1_i2.p1  ORF type:complete len:223 (-),score=40.34 TRINITY_DN1689_c0_g1_i2:486-1154(-)
MPLVSANVDYPTSLMIRNIPSRASAQEVTVLVDRLGFQGMYDFFYLPDRVVRRGAPVNYGYAFINFKDSQSSADFAAFIGSNRVSLRCSPKTLTVCHADVQGLDALLAQPLNKRGRERFAANPATGEMVSLEQAAMSRRFERQMDIQKMNEPQTLPGCAVGLPPMRGGSVTPEAAISFPAVEEEDEHCCCECTCDVEAGDLPMYIPASMEQHMDVIPSYVRF